MTSRVLQGSRSIVPAGILCLHAKIHLPDEPYHADLQHLYRCTDHSGKVDRCLPAITSALLKLNLLLFTQHILQIDDPKRIILIFKFQIFIHTD